MIYGTHAVEGRLLVPASVSARFCALAFHHFESGRITIAFSVGGIAVLNVQKG